MPNQEVAARTVELIKKHEDKFVMSWWAEGIPHGEAITLETDDSLSCGTSLCAAGWAVLAAGYKIDKNAYENDLRVIDPVTGETLAPFNGNGRYATDFCEAGARVLEISPGLANILFYTDEGRALVILEDLAAGRDTSEYLHEDYEEDDYQD